MTDKPIGLTPNGRFVYDNTATVVSLLIQFGENHALVVVRRNNEPGKGKLGLPGGYQMWGEKWREAGAREAKEETGYTIDPSSDDTVTLISLETDEYKNNLVIALTSCDTAERAQPTTPDEIQEVLIISDAGHREDWAFPRHFDAAVAFFALSR